MATAEINVDKMGKYIVLNVRIKGLRQLRRRISIACFLLRLAARVLGCAIEIEIVGGVDETTQETRT
jgi:hypothetical protein